MLSIRGLELNDSLTLPAFSDHQVPQGPRCGHPARTVDLTEERAEIFGSERLTSALLYGLTHRYQILGAKGESYRLRQPNKQSKHKYINSAATEPEMTQDVKGQRA
jgi:hypothetical protein